jgi:hypothetical protein
LTTFLLVTSSAFAVYLLGSAIYGAVNGGQQVIAHQEVPAEELDSLPPTASVSGPVRVTLRIPDAEPNQLFVATLRDLFMVALWMGVLWQVRGLLLSVREGDPFSTANVRRLRSIGFILVIGLPVDGIVTQLMDRWLAASSPVGELGSTFPPDETIGIVFGLGVFVLAEIFAHGVRLREDIEGTV